MRNDWLSPLAVLALSLAWGSSFLLIEIALVAFHPIAISAGRTALSAVAVVAALWLSGGRLPKGWRPWAWCTALGITSTILPFSLLSWGQTRVDTGVAALLISVGPLFTLALSRVVLGDPVGPRKWVGFVVGLIGLTFLIGPAALGALGDTAQIPGQIACLLCTLSYACSGILIRLMPPMPSLTATAAAQLAAALLILPAGILLAPAAMPAAPPLIALLILGAVQTGLAQLLRFWTVRRAGPVFVSTVGYLIPLWAGLLGVLVLGEAVTGTMIAAYLTILAGLVIARAAPLPAQKSKSSSRKPPRFLRGRSS